MRMFRQARAAMLTFAALTLGAAPAVGVEILPAGVDPSTGYRIANYRAPTPDFLPGGIVLDDAKAASAVSEGARVLIDVMSEGAVVDPLTDEWVVTIPRLSIPGAHWLPGVGTGRPEAGVEQRYLDALARLTRGRMQTGLMIFCIADCWHSWNAARRAIRAGYGDVAWYPNGTDGWRDLGLPLVPVEPNPIGEERR
jgi:PQQ-dependent catabolism-associated CXXCW motif protein